VHTCTRYDMHPSKHKVFAVVLVNTDETVLKSSLLHLNTMRTVSEIPQATMPIQVMN